MLLLQQVGTDSSWQDRLFWMALHDLAAQQPERVKQLSEQAMKISASIDASAEGKDYPEGKVIQAQRGARWSEMKEYQALYDKFAELKPDWKRPDPNAKTPKERKAEKRKNVGSSS